MCGPICEVVVAIHDIAGLCAVGTSYLNLQKAIAALSDNDLQASVRPFGRDMTKQSD